MRRARAGSCAAAASRTARGSRTGRSPRWSEAAPGVQDVRRRPRTSRPRLAIAGRRRRARGRDRRIASARSLGVGERRRRRRGDVLGDPPVPRASSRASGRWSWSSTTSTGPSRRSSTWSSTSRTGRATRRSCSCASARPELLDARPDWGGGKLNATTILLEPLAAESVDPAGREPARRRRTPRRGVATGSPRRPEGNPLFVEEMLVDADRRRAAASGEDGRVDVAGERSRARSRCRRRSQALLAARLDRLTADERRVDRARAP